MSIMRYQPLGTLASQIQDEMNKWFESRYPNASDESNVVTSSWIPSIDIKEDPEKFVLYADIPGVDPKDIEVTMEKGVLTIKGHKQNRREEKNENYTRLERFDGHFYRRFALPDTAVGDKIQARGKHGVLEITIPKAEKAQARKIEVTDHN